MVLERAERYGPKRVFLSKQSGRWEEVSWQTLGSKITRAAQGLAALGFRAGDRLAILAENRPEWPLIEEACVIGDKRPYLSVLIVPNRALTEALTRKHGLSGEWSDLLEHSELRTLFRRRINEVNRNLPLHARMRNFALLEQPFTIEHGELTSTLKVKRRVVAETRRVQIGRMYPPGSTPLYEHI